MKRARRTPTGAPVARRNATRRRPTRPAAPAAIIISSVLVLVLTGIAIFVVPPIHRAVFGSGVASGQEVRVTIPDGSGGDTIAGILVGAHVIEDPKDYYAAVTALGAEQSIKSGSYQFTTGQDAESVVRQLMEGPNVSGLKVTVPEGLTVSETAAKVQDALGVSADDFIAQAKASTYAADYPFLDGVAHDGYDTLEGFLCPKTYTFEETPTVDTVIRAMLDQYAKEYAALDFSGAESLIKSRYGLDMSDYQILIMASIVEREGLTDEQRLNVASTFYNRMRDGMALQSDATLMYETGGEVTASDIQTIESPYNTYKNSGLTPTPVCSPSKNSLKAALAPADTNYLYFYITSDKAVFSETYDGHLAAIGENSQ